MRPDGLGRLRQVDGEEVGLGHHLVEREQLGAELPGPLGADVRVEGEQAHPERGRPLRHQRPDPPQADDAQDLAVQLDALPAGSLPAPGDQRGVGLGHVAGLREQQRHGVLGRGQDVRLRAR